MSDRLGDVSSVVGRSANGTVVTVGSFDGVHLGHQAVLQEIAARAEAAGGRACW